MGNENRKEVKLASVKNLRKIIEDSSHSGLRELVANHTFVGCADREFALLQHATKLFVVNIGELTQHLFHQLMLLNFGNANVIGLDPPVDIKDMALIGKFFFSNYLIIARAAVLYFYPYEVFSYDF